MTMVLKICNLEWKNASRDKRELSVYRDLGYEVAVLAKGNPTDKGRVDEVDGFKVYRYSTRPLGTRVPAVVNRVISMFTWTRFVRELAPEIISGHNLIPALTIGWMAGLFRRKKPVLIYDSHEFELGKNTKRGRLATFVVRIWEGYLIRKSAFSIMVNDSIAEEVTRIHRLKEKPLVLRSTPDRWDLDEKACLDVRDKIDQLFGKKAFLIMYHGTITRGRGIETLMHVVERNEHIQLLILGDGQDSYVKELKKLAGRCAGDRIAFHPAVPYEEIWRYVGAADVGMITIPAVCKSYYFMLPNKFLENVQCLTPVIGSDFPEIRGIVKTYGIGLLCDPTDPEAINHCVEKMRTDSDYYRRCKENMRRAKEDLCWEKERNVLIDAVHRYIPL